jgi:acetamidase/formamidase
MKSTCLVNCVRAGCLLAIALPVMTHAKTYELKASPTTVHRGFFDASLPPVLTIDSGDTVKLETATGNPRYFEALGVPKEQIPAELYKVFEGVEGAGRGDHTLNGPIAVRGAEPGDSLEIRILKVDVRLPIAGQSFSPTGGTIPEEFPYKKDRVLWIDLKHKTIEYAPGVVVPAKPFWGVIATAPPAEMGRVSSRKPDFFGGNMDNRDLGAGSTLYLPVSNTGGLLSIGDGHAAQGEGEACGGAIETALNGEIQVILHKGEHLKWPRAETATHYMTVGINPDLNEAAKAATSEMVKFIVEKKGIDRETAYLLSSAAMDLIVTENVDGNKGIHAVIPKAIFTK